MASSTPKLRGASKEKIVNSLRKEHTVITTHTARRRKVSFVCQDEYLDHDENLDHDGHLDHDDYFDHDDHRICKEDGGCTQASQRLSDLT